MFAGCEGPQEEGPLWALRQRKCITVDVKARKLFTMLLNCFEDVVLIVVALFV